MNEQILPEAHKEGESDKSFPTPYNLNHFPAYREALLAEAPSIDDQADILQTFATDNTEYLKVLTDPNQPNKLTPDAQEKEFNEFYPAMDKVLQLHENLNPELATQRLKNLAMASDVEARLNPESYLNFWKTAKETAQINALAGVDAYKLNDDCLNRAQRELLSEGADLGSATYWYLQLGGLSRTRGAEAMMAYAARLPISAEAAGKKEAKYSTGEQLLCAGAMLSECSLLNERYGVDNLPMQKAYEAQSRQQFQTLIDSPDPSITSAKRRQARVYMIDMDMRAAHRIAREARPNNDVSRMQEAKVLAQESINKMADIALETQDEMRTTHSAIAANEARGELVERAILLLLQENTLRSGRLADDVPAQAFPRQDYPHDKLVFNGLPRSAFDISLTMVVPRESGKKPARLDYRIQAKNRKDDSKVYSPEILLMANLGEQVTGIVQAYRLRAIGSEASSGPASAKIAEFGAALRKKVHTLAVNQRQAVLSE